MLILQRKTNQAIVIGKDIEILITELKGDFVKLGIKAPKNISVHRKEIYNLIHKQNTEATKYNFDDIEKFSNLLKKS